MVSCCIIVFAGVAGAVLLPVAGVVGGAVQLGRGIANQKEAIDEKRKGRVWNKVSSSVVCRETQQDASFNREASCACFSRCEHELLCMGFAAACWSLRSTQCTSRHGTGVKGCISVNATQFAVDSVTGPGSTSRRCYIPPLVCWHAASSVQLLNLLCMSAVWDHH